MIRGTKGVTYQKQGCMAYGCNTGHLWCLTGLSGLRTVVNKIWQWKDNSKLQNQFYLLPLVSTNFP